MRATDDWGRTTPNPLSAIGVALASAPAFASAQPARALERASVRFDDFPGAQHTFLYLGGGKEVLSGIESPGGFR